MRKESDYDFDDDEGRSDKDRPNEPPPNSAAVLMVRMSHVVG